MSTYKMASDYIYKKKKIYEDETSVEEKNTSSHLHLEGRNTYTRRKNLVLNCFLKVQHRFELRLNPFKELRMKRSW